MITIELSERALRHLKIFLANVHLHPYEIPFYQEVIRALNKATMMQGKDMKFKITKEDAKKEGV